MDSRPFLYKPFKELMLLFEFVVGRHINEHFYD